MKHLERLFGDVILDTLEGFERIASFFKRTKQKQSLIADNVYWCTNSEWMDRLIAYKQLELWTADKQ